MYQWSKIKLCFLYRFFFCKENVLHTGYLPLEDSEVRDVIAGDREKRE